MQYKDSQSTLELFESTCQKHNIKVTPQRTVIFKELMRSNDHPSADHLYKKVKKILPNISFDTVYRTISTFADIGIVNVVEGHGDPKRFDPNLDLHHHFRCLKCNKIVDFNNEFFDKIEIPLELEKRFFIKSKKIVLEGLCDRCSKK